MNRCDFNVIAIIGFYFNTNPSCVVVPLDKLLCNNFCCLVDLNELQSQDSVKKFSVETRLVTTIAY